MRSLVTALAFLFITSQAYSQETTDERWAFIGQSKEKEKYYIDIKTQFSTDDVFGNKEVWIKCITPAKKLKKNGKTITYYNAVTLTLHEINCTNSEMRVKQEVIYDSKGKLLDSWENEFGSPKKVVPGSLGEMIMEESCKIH